MALRVEQIEAYPDENALFKLLSAELTERLGASEGDDLDLFVTRISQIPVGLRAMAAVYQLDVSLALDDLGWHFANWHHRGYCEATLWALGELGAGECAEIFAEAYEKVQPFWDEIGRRCARDFMDFVAWYPDSDDEANVGPAGNRRRTAWLLDTLCAQASRAGLRLMLLGWRDVRLTLADYSAAWTEMGLSSKMRAILAAVERSPERSANRTASSFSTSSGVR